MLDRRAMSGMLGAALLATAAAGCSEELGPEHLETARVEGSVRIAGSPVTSGWVEFIPVDGTHGNLRSTPIRKDGTFATDGVPVGRVAFALADLHGPAIMTALGPVERGIFRFFQTPIRKTIPSEPSSRLDVDLAVEAEAFLRDRLALQRRLNDPSE